MAAIPVTMLYGGMSALLTTVLGINTSRVRGKFKQFVGDTPSPEVVRASRAHGNNVEWTVIGIVLLLMLELSGAPSLWLHVFGGTLLAARLLHAIGVLAKSGISVAGAGLTYVLMVAMPAYALFLRFR